MSETVILGGGLAGGAAALLLARRGKPVRLLERDAEARDKICGEFLSIEAQRDLARLGLDVAALGAVPIDRLRLAIGRHQAEARLPFVAWGVSRRLLDEALLTMAASAGAQVERGVRATAISEGAVTTSTGAFPAARILLATGKHDLRGARRPAPRDGYVGFKMHWRPTQHQRAAIDGCIELVLFDGGYAGLQLVAPDVLNLCLIVRRERLAQAGGSWDALLGALWREPAIARRLDGARPLLPNPLTIANLPYGYVCRPETAAPAQVYRLGDQAAMTASLTGDGMALALRSAHVAVGSLLAGEDAATYHTRLRRIALPQIRRAMLLQRATESASARRAGIVLARAWPGLLATMAGATRLPRWRAA